MLYVSTRNRMDTYTAYRALHEKNAPDGGKFVPFQLVAFDAGEIEQLKQYALSRCASGTGRYV